MREKKCRIYKKKFQANDTSIIIIKEFFEQSVVTLPVIQNATLHKFLFKPQKKKNLCRIKQWIVKS